MSVTFPDTPRVLYEQNPIEEVICQLRFPTILEIGIEDPAAFQKLIRAEYPIYRKEDPGAQLPAPLAAIVSQLPLSPFPSVAERLTHRFLTANSQRSVSLTREFFAVSESRYERWEDFRSEVHRARQATEQVYEPAFYTRIGLRYRNVIDKGKLRLQEYAWSDLVSSALTGPLGEARIRDHVSDARSQVCVRLDEVPGGTVMLRYGLVERQELEPVYWIDSDFFTEGEWSGDDAIGILDTFNRLAGNFFRWAITRQLHAALGPRPVGNSENG